MRISSRPPSRPSSWRLLAIHLLGIAWIAGCATEIPGVRTLPPTADPSTESTALAEELRAGREAELDVLAPTWFGRALELHARAEEGLADGRSAESTLRRVAEGRASLPQARGYAKLSREALADVIEARAAARTAGAEKLPGGDYQDLEERLAELTAAIESDRLPWARKVAPRLEEGFRAVELAAIQRGRTEPIAELIERARDADAKRSAREELTDVEKRQADLERFITRNRYASDAIDERAHEVRFHASRLVHLTEEMRRLETLSAREQALENEAFLATLAQLLELPDLRSQGPLEQKRRIENAIEEVLGERHDLQARGDRLRNELDKAQGSVVALRSESERQRDRLDSEQRLRRRFEQISSAFEPGEAEVYMQDSKLVIRLYALHFPVGSAVVLPQSYAMLGKVERAIRSFERPFVVIEGHTDSTGSAEINDRISQERADAVLSYLVNRRTIPVDRISAVGKGFSEPVASDLTSEGRARNRRIDVIIDVGAESPGR